ncbi:MauE/DoxX family redox-associated membrane protein, partial [Streptomyces zhihengii]
MEYLLFGARCALALTLLASVTGKLRAPGGITGTVADLGIVPGRLVGPVGAAVIAAETSAIALVWLPGPAGVTAFLGAAALIAAFTAVLVVLIRRDDDVSCACFGASRTPVAAPPESRSGRPRKLCIVCPRTGRPPL